MLAESGSVLVVDDDIEALASIRMTLSGAGYTVTEAVNGRRALHTIMSSPPNILITEILMDDVDGIELIMATKRAHPDVHIIVLSERRFLGRLDLFDLASKLGADAELAKPVDAAKLLAVVTRIVDLDAAAK